jgi:8-oxo-dGTP diphosphatase
MTEYVCGFLFDPTFKTVALITKNKPDWQKGKLNGIGGKIEGVEIPNTTMQREFQEETGLLIDKYKWTPLAELRDGDAKIYFFYSTSSKIEDVMSMEDEPIALYDVTAIPSLNTIPNLAWLIPMCLDKDHSYARCITNKPIID